MEDRLAAADVLGAPEAAPFDRILVSAEAPDLPCELVDQLGPEGRMVMPVAGVLRLVVRRGGETEVSSRGRYRFVPLVPPTPPTPTSPPTDAR